MAVYAGLIAGFIFLIKGADVLVDGASSLARKLKVSDLVIGLTVVAFGTSMPELFVNIVASLKGNSDIAIGNILGSNTFNTSLILGISALIFPLRVTKGTVWKEIPLSFLAALLLGVLANDRLWNGADYSALTRTDGIVFIAFFIIFIYYTAGIAKDVEGVNEYVDKTECSYARAVTMVAAGLVLLILGSRWVVNGAVWLAQHLGVSQSFIGLTVVAAGTSLPELTTSVVAAYKRNAEIAVGNVVGSNIFNIFFILGVSALIKPLPYQPKTNVDVCVTIIASALLFLYMFTGKRHRIDRWEGLSLILVYAAYTVFLIIRR